VDVTRLHGAVHWEDSLLHDSGSAWNNWARVVTLFCTLVVQRNGTAWAAHRAEPKQPKQATKAIEQIVNHTSGSMRTSQDQDLICNLPQLQTQ
jgi:hypothetical protein